MEYCFFDTSALAKRYVDEAGSEWVSGLFESDEITAYIAEITTVEFTSAIVRRLNGRSISRDEAEDAFVAFENHLIRDYIVSEITSEILFDACRLVRKHGLRGYDAVQLAVAEFVNDARLNRKLPAITFVSADNILLAAAKSGGIVVENPNDHE